MTSILGLSRGVPSNPAIARSMVRDSAEGKTFLNLFAYTGAFTVYAAAGGAVRTTSVDLSANYLEWAGENLRLNGFTGREHRLVREDASEFLRVGHLFNLRNVFLVLNSILLQQLVQSRILGFVIACYGPGRQQR